jgi:hypothetical protein
MKISLNVNYEEKDEAKNNGAQWDPANKIWYLWDYKKIPLVNKWINNNYNIYITEHIYLVTGYRKCWKCNSLTKVYSIGADKFAFFNDGWKFYPVFYLINGIKLYSNNFQSILTNTNNKFKILFSKTINEKYLINTCEQCNMLQGDNFLYDEDDSVFSPVNESEVKNMTIKKIDVSPDIGLNGNIFISYNNGRNSNEIIWNGANHI